jgi:hypothetical protein
MFPFTPDFDPIIATQSTSLWIATVVWVLHYLNGQRLG